MNNPVSTMEEYLAQFSEEEQAVINRMRKRIKEVAPKELEEGIYYNMINYVIPLSIYPKGYHVTKGMPLGYVAIAKQKHFYALYFLGYDAKPEAFKEFVSRYTQEYGKLDMGKSCIRFKDESKIPYAYLDLLLGQLTIKEYIQYYESALIRGKK